MSGDIVVYAVMTRQKALYTAISQHGPAIASVVQHGFDPEDFGETYSHHNGVGGHVRGGVR